MQITKPDMMQMKNPKIKGDRWPTRSEKNAAITETMADVIYMGSCISFLFFSEILNVFN
jgi:hypothetical protein